MTETIHIGEVTIAVTRKDIKNVHLSVHPPSGRVTLSAPKATRLDVARAYAISKLSWIRDQQKKLTNQAREPSRQFINRESHYLWGRRHLMTVVHRDTKPFVVLDHKRITLSVRPGSDAAKRADVIHEWHKALLHEVVPLLIQKWERKLKVDVRGYFLQRMKTKWGSCNHRAGHIRLNTELVKKPKDLLEYVIVHEMAHLIEPTHSDRFIAILQEHYPTWREARAELNELTLAAEVWNK
jgi:predicted metal-dependent hydrolase